MPTTLPPITDFTGSSVTQDSFKDALTDLHAVVGESQTDVSGKQAALVSGTNIKTVNGISILGSGDLTVAAQKGTASVYGGAKFSLSGTTLTITTT